MVSFVNRKATNFKIKFNNFFPNKVYWLFDSFVLQFNIMLFHSDLTRGESAIAVMYKESQGIVFTTIRIHSLLVVSQCFELTCLVNPPLDLHIFSQLAKEMSFGLRFRLLLP